MMPPKKTAAEAKSKPASPDSSDSEGENIPKTDAAGVLKHASQSHPTLANMVKEALQALDSNKGISFPTIRSYIKTTYPSMDVDRLKHLLRGALMKGLENGTFMRPPSSAQSSGAQGSFRLAPQTKMSTKKTENSDPNAGKAPQNGKSPKKAGGRKGATASGQAKSSEDSKPPKKPEAKRVAASKVPSATKPKAKKIKAKDKDEGEEMAASAKPKAARTGKASKTKAAKEGSDAPKAPRKRVKKAAE